MFSKFARWLVWSIGGVFLIGLMVLHFSRVWYMPDYLIITIGICFGMYLLMFIDAIVGQVIENKMRRGTDMKFKEWKDKVDKKQFKDWKFGWKSFIWFSWEWIWKFSVICVVATMGSYLFASLNDTLSNFKDTQVYGSWMWSAYGVMYFGTLIYIIYRIAKIK